MFNWFKKDEEKPRAMPVPRHNYFEVAYQKASHKNFVEMYKYQLISTEKDRDAGPTNIYAAYRNLDMYNAIEPKTVDVINAVISAECALKELYSAYGKWPKQYKESKQNLDKAELNLATYLDEYGDTDV